MNGLKLGLSRFYADSYVCFCLRICVAKFGGSAAFQTCICRSDNIRQLSQNLLDRPCKVCVCFGVGWISDSFKRNFAPRRVHQLTRNPRCDSMTRQFNCVAWCCAPNMALRTLFCFSTAPEGNPLQTNVRDVEIMQDCAVRRPCLDFVSHLLTILHGRHHTSGPILVVEISCGQRRAH